MSSESHLRLTELRDDRLVARLSAKCHFPANSSSLTCAVSGGADSSALLVLAVATGADVTAVHVDHGLREGSHREADLVAALAERLGAKFERREVVVEEGGDLEARARQARHDALPVDALFGHTADDQAETVLLRIIRGTGPAGLAAMRRHRHPILGLRRRECVELCDHLGIGYFSDPSNQDPRFRRNRVRKEVLPVLSDVAERDVVPLLCRLADLSADQADLIGSLAAELDPQDAKALSSAHPSIAAEAVRRWWLNETTLQYPPEARAIERILGVAAGRHLGCEVSDGWSVRRSRSRLSLVRTDDMSRSHVSVKPSQD